ncbi:hypothetical protein PCLA_20f0040 [Pseudomonas citronellolis]|nr:hypothetical protein PCLA_20f0040 [Pseudomonas citronellolis]
MERAFRFIRHCFLLCPHRVGLVDSCRRWIKTSTAPLEGPIYEKQRHDSFCLLPEPCVIASRTAEIQHRNPPSAAPGGNKKAPATDGREGLLSLRTKPHICDCR